MIKKVWSTMLLVGLMMGLVGCSVIPAKPSKSEKSDVAEVEADSLLMAQLADALSVATEESRVSKIEREEVKNQVMGLSESVAAVQLKMSAMPPLITADEVRQIFKEEDERKAASHDGACQCGCQEKLAEIAKEIEPLKERIVLLEARPAYATSSYGSASSSSSLKSGGSTGSVASGGSTGAVKSGGSTGNVASGGSTGTLKSGGSTGNVRQSQPAGPSIDAHIVIVTTPSCQRCGSIVAEVTRVYSASGWTVETVSEPAQPGVSYPYYRVCVGSQCEEVHCDVSQLTPTIEGVLTKWGVTYQTTAAEPANRQPLRTALKSAAASTASAAGNLLTSWGDGRALEVAVASAQHRAANRIKGHSQVDLSSGMANGVGWSPVNSQPKTCFWNRRGQGAYASVQGYDGFYATLVLP